MRRQIDMGKIARGLRAERRGKVASSGGWIGAMGLVAEVEARFRVPEGGGRPTDPSWTERRLVPLAPQTLRRLEALASRVCEERGVNIAPMQLAALLLESTTLRITDEDAEGILRQARVRRPGS